MNVHTFIIKVFCTSVNAMGKLQGRGIFLYDLRRALIIPEKSIPEKIQFANPRIKIQENVARSLQKLLVFVALQPLSSYSWNTHTHRQTHSQLYRIPPAATPRGIINLNTCCCHGTQKNICKQANKHSINRYLLVITSHQYISRCYGHNALTTKLLWQQTDIEVRIKVSPVNMRHCLALLEFLLCNHAGFETVHFVETHGLLR